MNDHSEKRRLRRSPLHHAKRGFSNPSPDYRPRSLGEIFRWVFVDREKGQRKKNKQLHSLARVANDGAFLRANNTEFTVTWAGHSTVLIQMEGHNILMDPIWSNRASPLPFVGPKRYISPGIEFENLPEIDVVVLSHNHYDHFDKRTIRKLRNGPLFIVPMGFGRELRRMHINNYRELDWWESFTAHGVEFVCTPAQHYSARRLTDHGRSLWCSWAVRGIGNTFFFAGDTGYFGGLSEIGNRYGPFDLVCLPIGAYLPRRYLSYVHMSPEESVKAYRDLRGRIFLAIHWGTFNLGNDPPTLAPEQLMNVVADSGLDETLFWVLKHGETRVIHHTPIDS